MSTPSLEHVKWQGKTVPVHDYMLSAEVELLEQLRAKVERGELKEYQADLECFLICARCRVPEYQNLTREDFGAIKITTKTRNDLREKTRALISPFTDMQLELNKSKGLELLKEVTPEKLDDAITQMEVTLKELRAMRTGIASASASTSRLTSGPTN